MKLIWPFLSAESCAISGICKCLYQSESYISYMIVTSTNRISLRPLYLLTWKIAPCIAGEILSRVNKARKYSVNDLQTRTLLQPDVLVFANQANSLVLLHTVSFHILFF